MPEYMVFHCECNDELAVMPAVVVAIPVVQLDNVQPIAVQLRKYGLSKAYRSQEMNAYVLEQSSVISNLVDAVVDRLTLYDGTDIPMLDIDENVLIELEDENEFEYDIFLVINEYDQIYAELTIQDGWITFYDVSRYPLDGKLDPNF